MSEPSATGPSIGGASPNVERPVTRPGVPAAATGGATVSARGDAVVLVALARLERDHVALLAALCDLEAPAARRAKPSAKATGTQGISAAMRDALAALLRADLRQTQHALALAAEGRYGACEGCQTALSSVALLTTPATTHCASCAGSAARASQVH